MNRRDLLTAAPLAALSAAVPAVARPSETPVMTLFRQWKAEHDWLNGAATDGMPRDEFDIEAERLNDIEAALYAAPAQDSRDMLAKLAVYGDAFLNDLHADRLFEGLLAEARAMIGGAA